MQQQALPLREARDTAAEFGPPSVTGDDLMAALRWSEDPAGPIEYVVDGMTRDELALALAAPKGSRRESPDEKRDLHRFANSLAPIALSGVVTEPISAPSLEIEFATHLGDASQGETGENLFASSSGRIFGLFALEAGAEQRVIAKWYRVDDPEILMFQELPVREQEGRGFIRLDRAKGWPPGS